MEHKLHGTTMQALELTLARGETIFSQTHQLAWMDSGVDMNTNTGGGFFKGLLRTFSGASLFVNNFTANRDGGLVAFCPRFPGTIMATRLAAGQSLICRKETFLCAEQGVLLEPFFRQQIGSGLFGGEGFILQKVTGPGMVFLDLSGEVVEKNLKAGETIRVHVGHVGVQDPTVQFGVQLVKGWKNFLFGGDGLFFATLTGPGRVLLQTMPIVNLADEIMKYAGGARQPDTGASVAADVVGDVLGGFLRS
jgi:uncharacterized protein (TIGR00266 family)